MFAIKYKKVCDDPEMFDLSGAGARGARGSEGAYDRLVDQIAHIVRRREAGRVSCHGRQGLGACDFRRHDPLPSPCPPEEWSDPALSARIDALLTLLLRGLEAPRKR
jgi:hypothetical protein